MRVTYQERIDSDTVVCNVRWDLNDATVNIAVRIAATIDEVPVPDLVPGVSGIRQDTNIPIRLKIQAAQKAQRVAAAFTILSLEGE